MPTMKKFGQCFQVTSLYIGAVIGAGFASGQEIMQFFIIFGSRGLWGVALATLLFAGLEGLVMSLITFLRATSYVDLLPRLMGKKLARAIDVLSLIMLPGGLAVMLAGSGAVFDEQFGLPAGLGILLAALITALVILGGLEGVLMANMILVPVKILVISLVCFFALIHHGGWPQGLVQETSFTEVGRHWFWSSII